MPLFYFMAPATYHALSRCMPVCQVVAIERPNNVHSTASCVLPYLPNKAVEVISVRCTHCEISLSAFGLLIAVMREIHRCAAVRAPVDAHNVFAASVAVNQCRFKAYPKNRTTAWTRTGGSAAGLPLFGCRFHRASSCRSSRALGVWIISSDTSTILYSVSLWSS